jgi:hypothetical protein
MMKNNTNIERAYQLESLLRVLSLAADGEQIAGKTFNASGGGNILDMAADMAGELVNQLELAKTAQNVTA